ncbi:acylphosphatase [Halanaerobium praevalens]|uniref:acylphosphatase n=1 Tax=Halanaerobium praevalens (strain ATCC 33744 / DSM 2228 / GSL) TaxID=572479 RepID=E3DS13_HALPG|nr:acylphosphatase [Halanaerobium praevalens]ADO77137.1 acylphosphatase [Halanaerobium praevalens DSM 2228]
MTVKKVQKQIFISGRVQGVGFRAFCQKQASALKIKGWVKNLKDSRVEAVIEGKETNIRQMIKKLKKGPSFARVDNLKIIDRDLTGFNNFEIKY